MNYKTKLLFVFIIAHSVGNTKSLTREVESIFVLTFSLESQANKLNRLKNLKLNAITNETGKPPHQIDQVLDPLSRTPMDEKEIDDGLSKLLGNAIRFHFDHYIGIANLSLKKMSLQVCILITETIPITSRF